ncbi:hypothetical protein [Streptomyces sp. NPDC021139]|uniref:hypothetical protein n=1 Tax=unclassified Streptomyces TaxID=2593676 RepID=UPI00340B825A
MELRHLPRTTDQYGRPAYLYSRGGKTYRIERQAGGRAWQAIAPGNHRLCPDKPSGRACVAALDSLLDHWQTQAHYEAVRTAKRARQEAAGTRIDLAKARHGDRVRLPLLDHGGDLTGWTRNVRAVDKVEHLRTDPDAAMLYYLLTDDQQAAGHWRFTLMTGAHYDAGLLRLHPAA